MKALIFDMDGLMIDSESLYFETDRELAQEFGKTVKDETLWKMMGRKPIEAMAVYAEDLGMDICPEELLRIRNKRFAEKLKKSVVPMPGLFEILNEFKGRMKLSIATGSSTEFLKIVLDSLKLHDYFDELTTSDEIRNGKPDPEIYLKSIAKVKLKPEDCIVLEDSGNGALAGKRAGCYTIAVPSELTYEQDFSFVDYKAADLHDAREHIKKRFDTD